jgi:hypothetical protein
MYRGIRVERFIEEFPDLVSEVSSGLAASGRENTCAFSIFVFTGFIGLFRPALFLHPRMIHPLDP